MDNQREFRVEPVSARRTGRALPVATFVIGIFLGAAVIKPWDLLSPARIGSPEGSGSSTSAVDANPLASTPPSGPTPKPPGECAFAGGWRVFAVGQSDRLGGDGSTSGDGTTSAGPSTPADIGNPLRRWLEIDPLTSASGPADRRIPFVMIVSDQISGIGYCPPPNGADGPPPGALLDAWSIDMEGTPTQMPLRRVVPGSATTIEIDIFIGADVAAGDRARWPPGRYVFVVQGPGSGRYARWLGVEVRTPPGKEPSPG